MNITIAETATGNDTLAGGYVGFTMPSVARRAQLMPTPAITGWSLLYRYPAFVATYTALPSGPVTTLPNAVTGQSYTLSGSLTANGSGSLTGAVVTPQGLDQLLTGDLVCLASGNLLLTLTTDCFLYRASGTVWLFINGQTIPIASLPDSAVAVYRLTWQTTATATSIQAGAALAPQLPFLNSSVQTLAPLTTLDLSFRADQGGSLGGVGTKYAVYCTTPNPTTYVAWPLQYATNRFLDDGTSFPTASSGQSYTGATTVLAATSYRSPGYTGGGPLNLSYLSTAITGDAVVVGPAGLAAFPTLTLTAGVTMQAASATSVTLTVNGTPVTVATALPASGSWVARLQWTTSGATTTYAAGAGGYTGLTTPPTTPLASSAALTSVAPTISALGTLGAVAPVANPWTATPIFPAIAQISVPFVPISITESASDTPQVRIIYRRVEAGFSTEQVRTIVLATLREAALGTEMLSLQARLTLLDLATARELCHGQLTILPTTVGSASEQLTLAAVNLVRETAVGLDRIVLTIDVQLTDLAIGNETLHLAVILASTAVGAEELRLFAQLNTADHAHGIDTINNVGVLAYSEFAYGSEELTPILDRQVADTALGHEQLARPLTVAEAAFGTEQTTWWHSVGTVPGQTILRLGATSSVLPVLYTSIAQTVNTTTFTLTLNGIVPPVPIGATGPLLSANQLPIGSVFTFYFDQVPAPLRSQLLALQGIQGPATLMIPDGRWYTLATVAFSAADTTADGQGATVLVTLVQPLNLAQPIQTAQFY